MTEPGPIVWNFTHQHRDVLITGVHEGENGEAIPDEFEVHSLHSFVLVDGVEYGLWTISGISVPEGMTAESYHRHLERMNEYGLRDKVARAVSR